MTTVPVIGDQKMKFEELLVGMGKRVSRTLMQWAKHKSIEQFWKECERADLMLELLGLMAGEPGWPTLERVVLMSADCAETVQHRVPAGEERPRKAIATARAWAVGEATIEEVRAAAADAYAAYVSYAADDDAAADAADAAHSAASAAYSGNAADDAYAAAAAAAAVAEDDAYAADEDADAAKAKKLAELADLIRPRFSPTSVTLGLER